MIWNPKVTGFIGLENDQFPLKEMSFSTALDYEVSQLEKLGTWVIEDLPKGHSAIPCGEVLKVKRGPNGEIQSYWVQVEGLNYTETFSSAAKMPTVGTVLANAANQNWKSSMWMLKVLTSMRCSKKLYT